MAIDDEGWRMSQVAGCVERAALYRLSETEARSIVDNQVDVIRLSWDEVCDLAALTSLQRRQMWGSQFLNEYALYDY
jgi:serine/threonine-protein kinase HipA